MLATLNIRSASRTRRHSPTRHGFHTLQSCTLLLSRPFILASLASWLAIRVSPSLRLIARLIKLEHPPPVNIAAEFIVKLILLLRSMLIAYHSKLQRNSQPSDSMSPTQSLPSPCFPRLVASTLPSTHLCLPLSLDCIPPVFTQSLSSLPSVSHFSHHSHIGNALD